MRTTITPAGTDSPHVAERTHALGGIIVFLAEGYALRIPKDRDGLLYLRTLATACEHTATLIEGEL